MSLLSSAGGFGVKTGVGVREGVGEDVGEGVGEVGGCGAAIRGVLSLKKRKFNSP